MSKYIKPQSLTWWGALVPLLAGAFLALEPLHQLAEWVQVINSMTGYVEPAVLINAGVVAIGMRGAIGGESP